MLKSNDNNHFIKTSEDFKYCSEINDFCIYAKVLAGNVLEISGKGKIKSYSDKSTDFIEKIINTVFNDKKLYLIHNLSDFVETDPASRLKYFKWILKNHYKFSGIFFTNIKFHHEIQILSAKLLSPKLKNVKIFKTTSDAVNYLKSNNKITTSKNHLFSNVSVDIQQNKLYKILIFKGLINDKNKKDFIDYLQKVIFTENVSGSESKALVVDFKGLSGNPFLYHRSVFGNKKPVNDFTFYIIIDQEKYTKIRLWTKKNYPEFKFIFVNDIDEAINKIEQNITENKDYNINYFQFEGKKFTIKTAGHFKLHLPEDKLYENKIINHNIIIAELSGKARYKKSDMVQINNHIDNIISSEKLKKPYWLFIDFKNFSEVTVKARKEFVDWLLMHHEDIERVVPYNMSKTMFIISSFISKIVRHKINASLAKDFDDALNIYLNNNVNISNNTSNNQSIINASKEDLMLYIEELEKKNEDLIKEREENIENLFTILGKISWGENSEFKVDIDESNPYYKIYGATEVLYKDINHMLQVRNELLKKAEESDRLKSAFLSNLSHEIRTPLNGIIGFTSLLLESKQIPDTAKNYLKIIDKSGNRLIKIIDDLLHISKLETNQYTITYKNSDINVLFDELYNHFINEAGNKQLKIDLKYDKNNPLIINTDAGALYQILKNLLANAVKYTDKGNIELGYQVFDETVKFYVKDTGIGIQPEKVKVIFQNFRQSEEKTNRDYEGAGLGLSIAQGICNLLGSEIKVESAPNKGSIFYFFLPKNVVMINY